MRKIFLFLGSISVYTLSAQLVVKSNGRIGLGITSPTQKLEVSGIALFTGTGLETVTTTGTYIGNGVIYSLATGANANDLTFQGKTLTFYTGLTYTEKMRIDVSGNVGIGTTSPTEKLSVSGNIKANGLFLPTGSWPDYVFEKKYRLRSLDDLEKFIYANKHLPDLPSAKEVDEKGVSVGENQALLLKKIEELTLYMIELNKKNGILTKRIAMYESQKKN